MTYKTIFTTLMTGGFFGTPHQHENTHAQTIFSLVQRRYMRPIADIRGADTFSAK